MSAKEWFQAFPGAVTVCDRSGVILEMNGRARETFAKSGGGELIGKRLLDCHPEPARTKLQHLLATGGTNAYTIEKAGKKKLIYQAPWFENGAYAGLVELSLEIPFEMPHFVRNPG